jgi:hypothetical protein
MIHPRSASSFSVLSLFDRRARAHRLDARRECPDLAALAGGVDGERDHAAPAVVVKLAEPRRAVIKLQDVGRSHRYSSDRPHRG